MSNEPTITITGNLTGDPNLHYTPTGQALARFIIAATPRRYDRTCDTWIDGETIFMRATAWRDLAEHVAETLTKGTRVIATGRLRQNTWTTEDGQQRWSIDLDIDDLGPSLQWATATVAKAGRQQQPPRQTSDAAPAGEQGQQVSAGSEPAGAPPF